MYYVFLLPALLFLAVFGFYPPISALYHAFTDWNGATAQWIGLQNFRFMLEDGMLVDALRNMAILVIVGLVIGNVMNLIGAILVFHVRSSRLAAIYRYLFILPMVVPGIVVMLLWQHILDPLTGLANLVLGWFGVSPLGWLGDPDLALWSIIMFGFPWVAGLGFLIYLAGLQNISQEVIECAELEGATGLKRVFRIELPLITSQIKLMFILGIINGLQGFGVQLAITKGGPGTATTVPGWMMYEQAFMYSKFGYSSMIGLMMFIVILVLTFINMKFVKTES